MEFDVADPKNVTVCSESDENAPTSSPPLVMRSLSIRTVMNHQKGANEIVAASGCVFNQGS